MRVLFLDIDGVLNSDRWFEAASKRARRRAKGAAKARNPLDALDPAAVRRLNVIVERTNAAVVLSSAWRNPFTVEEVTAFLQQKGFCHALADRTPKRAEMPPDYPPPDVPYERGHEIAVWLRAHPDVTAFAILDDSDDMANMRDRLVRTEWVDGGLQDEHVERVVALLETPA